jgi:hypothetical protein
MQFSEQEFAESQSESGMESQGSSNADTMIEDRQHDLYEEWTYYVDSVSVIDNKAPEIHSDVWKNLKEKERRIDRAKLTRFANRFDRPDYFFYEPSSNMQRLEPPTIHEFSAGNCGSIKLCIQRDAGYQYAGEQGERKPKLLGNAYGSITRVGDRNTDHIPKQAFLAQRMDQDISFALNQHFKDVPEEDIPDRVPVDQVQKILDSQIKSFDRQICRRNRLDRQKAIISQSYDQQRLLFQAGRLKVNVLQSEAIRREHKSKTVLAKRAPEVDQTKLLKKAAELKRKQRALKTQNESPAELKSRNAKAALQKKALRAAKKGKLSLTKPNVNKSSLCRCFEPWCCLATLPWFILATGFLMNGGCIAPYQ